ncbi:MAG: MOSC domain-containing protein [Bradyrhizobiaceae bacterium]|nr:MAG: MOSC domain-containing protein [Bradyrhizobiaceae bacterium]
MLPGSSDSEASLSERKSVCVIDVAFVSQIQIYPIKSLDAVVLQKARVMASGALEHDRRWAMFDANGKFVNGKHHATIHRLRSRFNLDNQTLVLHEGGQTSQSGPAFSLDRDRGKIEEWLGVYFGFPVKLTENDQAGFPDDTDSPGPTIISVATLKEIAQWFSLSLEETRARFRTNIEIDGVPPFWEDRLFGKADRAVRFTIGTSDFEGINPCQRCVVPTRNPLSGMADKAFVQRFMEYRRQTMPDWSERSRFDHFYRVAVNTRGYGKGGTICAGDAVRIIDP